MQYALVSYFTAFFCSCFYGQGWSLTLTGICVIVYRNAKSGILMMCRWVAVLSVNYFQEWVTDLPFIISPRITFEVSVRLLGGLMALGYTIASILKRSSHIFSGDKICVKTDWLEQLNRKYVQVLYQSTSFLWIVSNILCS